MSEVFRPLHDYVLLEKHEAMEQKSPGGIVLPKAAGQSPDTADVVAIGPSVKGLSEGDVVVVGQFSGTEITLDDVEYVVVKFEDILGVCAG